MLGCPRELALAHLLLRLRPLHRVEMTDVRHAVAAALQRLGREAA